MSIGAPDRPVRVMIADHDRGFLAGLRSLLAAIPDVEVVGEAATGVEAVRVARRMMPNLVLIDADLPVLDGIRATRSILAESPDTAILILTQVEHHQTVIAALRAGARGYLLKNADVPDVIRALDTLRSGGAIFGAQVAAQVIEFLSHPMETSLPFPLLSHRERDILELAADGKTNAEIAVKLGISVKTVRNYLSRIIATLGVADRGEATALARREGLGL